MAEAQHPKLVFQELRISMKKTAIFSLLTASAVTVGVAIGSFVPAASSALAADKLSIQYDLYTRGMRAFALNYDADIASNAYKARAKLQAKGACLTGRGPQDGHEVRRTHHLPMARCPTALSWA
jgi:hypothetical protein